MDLWQQPFLDMHAGDQGQSCWSVLMLCFGNYGKTSGPLLSDATLIGDGQQAFWGQELYFGG